MNTRGFIHLLAAASFLAGVAPADAQTTTLPAQQKLKRRADGVFFIHAELKVCLSEDFAKRVSFKNGVRIPVDKAAIVALDSNIQGVRGGHTSADAWLKGAAFPRTLRAVAGAIPEPARCITLVLKENVDTEAVMTALRRSPAIRWAELSTLAEVNAVPNDPEYTSQWAPAVMGLDPAWDVPQRTTGLRIAIVDSGVDLEHPDLNIIYNAGFGDNKTSGDAMNSSPDPAGEPSRNHGTHVAGIAGAIRNNKQGVAGVAAAQIMAMGCATWNSMTKSWQIRDGNLAIIDAVDNGAHVINCSFECSTVGGTGADRDDMNNAFRTAVDHARSNNVLVVAAAGNTSPNGLNIANTRWASHPWVIVVTNTINAPGEPLRVTSNFGSGVDLAGPGTNIRSTFVFSNDGNAANDYGDMTGTSMASPQVAGAAARVWSLNPSLLDAPAVKSIVTRMSRFYADLGAPGIDDLYGSGRLAFSVDFLQPIHDAAAFAISGGVLVPGPNGTYGRPYVGLDYGLKGTPDNGMLLLKGGDRPYRAKEIKKKCTLAALPDNPVTIEHP